MPDKNKQQQGRPQRNDMGQQSGKSGQGQQHQQDDQRRQQGGGSRSGGSGGQQGGQR